MFKKIVCSMLFAAACVGVYAAEIKISTEQWGAASDIEFTSRTGDILAGKFSGVDPKMVVELSTPVDIADIEAIKFDLKLSPKCTNIAQIFWATSEKSGFGGQHIDFRVANANGQWHTFSIRPDKHPNWKGKLIKLRFDPAVSPNPNCGFELRNVRIITRKKVAATGLEITVNDWQKTQHIGNISKDGGVFGGDFNGIDPAMISATFSPIPVDQIKSVTFDLKLTYKCSNKAQFFWQTAESPKFGGQHIDFRVISDGEWHTYRLLPKTHPNWKGNLIKLRLDPAVSPNPNCGFELRNVRIETAN